MLTLCAITLDHPDRARVNTLYERAFPQNERGPIAALFEDATGTAKVFGLFEGRAFCGFLCLLLDAPFAHILYFAVEERMRGRGIGGAALRAVRDRYPGSTFLADVEQERPGAPNNDQRRRRVAFYLKNGFSESPVHYTWRGEDYQILAAGDAPLSDALFFGSWHRMSARNPAFRSF